MTRTVFPFVAKDVSALARSLHRELEACESPPGHLQLLNMLSRSAGYRNFQHFRAQSAAQDRLEQNPAEAEPVDHLKVERVAAAFDDVGRLVRWPSKVSHQALALWGLWSRLPRGVVMTERQISEALHELHLFGDHALLRRELIDRRMVWRTPDCRAYERIERRPPADAVALIRRLGRGHVPERYVSPSGVT